MSTEPFVLSEFAYFDCQKIEDFLSAIENGLPKETTEITHETDTGLSQQFQRPVSFKLAGS